MLSKLVTRIILSLMNGIVGFFALIVLGLPFIFGRRFFNMVWSNMVWEFLSGNLCSILSISLERATRMVPLPWLWRFLE